MSSKKRVRTKPKTVFDCKVCEEEFDNKETLKEHKKSAHKETLLCNICGKIFKKRQHLNDHTNAVHDGIKDFKCDKCDKAYIHNSQLKRHIRSFHDGIRDFICSFCGKAFLKNQHMQHHIKQVHENIRDHKCDFCGKAFSRSTFLDQHVRNVHEGVKNFQCDQCERAFAQKANLNHHIKIVHKGKRDFPCSVCGKEFGSKQQQETHKETVHEGAKNFNCDRCGKAFGRRENLNRHLEGMHSETKDFVCTSCGKAFGVHEQLRRHLKKVHDIVIKIEPRRPKVIKPVIKESLNISKASNIPASTTSSHKDNKTDIPKPMTKPGPTLFEENPVPINPIEPNSPTKIVSSNNINSKETSNLHMNKNNEIKPKVIAVKPIVLPILPIKKEEDSSNDSVQSILDDHYSDNNFDNDSVEEGDSPDLTEDCFADEKKGNDPPEKFDLSDGLEKFREWKKQFSGIRNHQLDVKVDARSKSRERIQQLKLANSLLSALSEGTRQTVKSMGVAIDDCNAIITAIEQHLSRPKNDSFSTHQLFTTLRAQNEDIESFARSVKEKAAETGYPAAILDRLMKDAFIITINDAEISSRLLEVPSTAETTLTFAKAVEIATSIYRARRKHQ